MGLERGGGKVRKAGGGAAQCIKQSNFEKRDWISRAHLTPADVVSTCLDFLP